MCMFYYIYMLWHKLCWYSLIECMNQMTHIKYHKSSLNFESKFDSLK